MVRIIFAVITLAEAATFVGGAIAHMGMPLVFGSLRIAEPRILPAVIAESICALALIVGAFALLSGWRSAWGAVVTGHVIALGGVLLGMAALALGAGPRTPANDLYHRAILIVLAMMLVVLRRPAIRRRVRSTLIAGALALAVSSCSAPPPSSAAMTQQPRWGIVIHTGAGNFTLDALADRREPMRAAMTQALREGHRVLAAGGSSLEAVQAAVVVLEDSPHFNAGKGAVFTHEGSNELDASIMDGASRRAGAVAGVRRIKNPILLARLVMEKSPHVMMAGAGAEAFALEQGGIEFVAEDYFRTDRAWEALQRALEQERQKTTTGASAAPAMERDAPAGYFGTVGAVALDQQGNLAAATSTGGMTNKRFGRIGDSPVVGAGTYASNDSCAISATGHGEYFIRYAVAHEICARVEHRGTDVQAAADAVVLDVLKRAGGEGGVIGLDRSGRIAMSLNTSGMGRGYMGQEGEPVVLFTAEERMPERGDGER